MKIEYEFIGWAFPIGVYINSNNVFIVLKKLLPENKVENKEFLENNKVLKLQYQIELFLKN